MKKILFFSIIAFLSDSICAGHAWNSVKIKRVLVHDNGSSNYSGIVHIYMDTDMPDENVPSCLTQDIYKSHFAINLSRSGANAQYTAILAAYMADKYVIIDVNNSCIEGIPELRNIYIVK